MNLNSFFNLQSKNYKYWFTLVELIIVITILAILSTVWVISFQKYIKQARDTNRISNLKTIEKWLNVFFVKNTTYPIPDDHNEISASGTIVLYQWFFGDKISGLLWIGSTPLDPIDNTRYIYNTNFLKNKYQLMTFIEQDYSELAFDGNSSIIYASDYLDRKPKVIGDNLWIILTTDNGIPNKTLNWIDLVNYNSWTVYKLYFSNKDIIIWSWTTIFSNLYNKRTDLIIDKNLAYFDENLVGYWDMETVFSSWWVNYLKDWSKYNNYWICSENWVNVSCLNWQKWPKLISDSWQKWKAFYFDGANDKLYIPSLSWVNFPQTEWTIYIKVKTDCTSQTTNLWNIFDTRDNTRKHMFFRCVWGSWPSYNFQFEFEWINLGYYVAGDRGFLDSNRNELILTFNYSKKTVSFFANGILRRTQIFSDDYNTIWQLMYFWWNWWDWFQWNLDEVRLYNRAFSSSEVSDLYNMMR